MSIGCFGNSQIDRYLSRSEARFTDESHHPRCKCSDEYAELEGTLDDEGNEIQFECTCDNEYEEDKVDAQLSQIDY